MKEMIQKEINLSKCSFSEKIPLNQDGRFDDCANGAYGYRVFFDVPVDEIRNCGLFKNLPDTLFGGQIEFTITASGELNCDEEVLLWISEEDEDEDDYIENTDFVHYNGNIDTLIRNLNQ